MRSSLATLYVLILAVALSSCSNVEERPISGLILGCSRQPPKSHQRAKSAGYLVYASDDRSDVFLSAPPHSNDGEMESPPFAMALLQMAPKNPAEAYIVLTYGPEQNNERGDGESFKIPMKMFEYLKAAKDFRIKTTNGGTASYNDKVEIIYDSYRFGEREICTYTIEEIRKL